LTEKRRALAEVTDGFEHHYSELQSLLAKFPKHEQGSFLLERDLFKKFSILVSSFLKFILVEILCRKQST